MFRYLHENLHLQQVGMTSSPDQTRSYCVEDILPLLVGSHKLHVVFDLTHMLHKEKPNKWKMYILSPFSYILSNLSHRFTIKISHQYIESRRNNGSKRTT
jgi:hypothetical protein